MDSKGNAAAEGQAEQWLGAICVIMKYLFGVAMIQDRKQNLLIRSFSAGPEFVMVVGMKCRIPMSAKNCRIGIKSE